MRRRRVELAQQESSLTSSLVTYDVPRDREAVHQQLFGVRHGRSEELRKVLVSLLVLVTCFAPLRDSLAVEDEDVEKGIEKEDDVRLDRDRVEEDRLRWCIERVRYQRRLDHDQRIVHVRLVQNVPVERRLVRAVVEHLEELTPPQVEHKLGVDTEVVSQSERCWVFLPIVGELLAQPDEHPVEPP